MKTPENFTREDWIEIGLQLLITDGEKFLTIDRLCKTAARTKGSFYHHFKSHDSFVVALLEYWQSRYTSHIISTVERLEDLNDRRRELDRLAASIDSDIERAIRRWSSIDERVQRTLKQVDDQRIRYLTEMIGQLGKLNEEVAFELAVIEYAAFIGIQYLFPEADSKWLERIINRVTQLTQLTCSVNS